MLFYCLLSFLFLMKSHQSCFSCTYCEAFSLATFSIAYLHLFSSSIFAWKISWTEDPGGLRSVGLQRAGHNWVTEYSTQIHICFQELANDVPQCDIPCMDTVGLLNFLDLKSIIFTKLETTGASISSNTFMLHYFFLLF